MSWSVSLYSLDTYVLNMYFWLSTQVGGHLSDIWIILAKIQQNATRCLCLETNVQLQLEKSCNMLLMTDMFSPFLMYKTYLLVQEFSQLVIGAGLQLNAIGTNMCFRYMQPLDILFVYHTPKTGQKQCYLHVTSADFSPVRFQRFRDVFSRFYWVLQPPRFSDSQIIDGTEDFSETPWVFSPTC